MMSNGPARQFRRRRWGGRLTLAAFACLLQVGCAPPASRITFLSYKDPYFPEPLSAEFDRAFAYRTPSGDRHFVAERTAPALDAQAGEVRQLLHLHQFWQPRPGRTYANETLRDATAQFVVVTGTGVVCYSGAAFVYPQLRPEPDGRTRVGIEDGRLRLESVDVAAPEVLGDAKLHGELFVREDAAAAVELRREIERLSAGVRLER